MSVDKASNILYNVDEYLAGRETLDTFSRI